MYLRLRWRRPLCFCWVFQGKVMGQLPSFMHSFLERLPADSERLCRVPPRCWEKDRRRDVLHHLLHQTLGNRHRGHLLSGTHHQVLRGARARAGELLETISLFLLRLLVSGEEQRKGVPGGRICWDRNHGKVGFPNKIKSKNISFSFSFGYSEDLLDLLEYYVVVLDGNDAVAGCTTGRLSTGANPPAPTEGRNLWSRSGLSSSLQPSWWPAERVRRTPCCPPLRYTTPPPASPATWSPPPTWLSRTTPRSAPLSAAASTGPRRWTSATSWTARSSCRSTPWFWAAAWTAPASPGPPARASWSAPTPPATCSRMTTLSSRNTLISTPSPCKSRPVSGTYLFLFTSENPASWPTARTTLSSSLEVKSTTRPSPTLPDTTRRERLASFPLWSTTGTVTGVPATEILKENW